MTLHDIHIVFFVFFRNSFQQCCSSVVEQLHAMKNPWVRFLPKTFLEPKTFAFFSISQPWTTLIFPSLPTTATSAFLRNELFYAVTLKLGADEKHPAGHKARTTDLSGVALNKCVVRAATGFSSFVSGVSQQKARKCCARFCDFFKAPARAQFRLFENSCSVACPKTWVRLHRQGILKKFFFSFHLAIS